jgi:predicted RNA-binding protein YlxR (DUF448 family)
MGKKTKRRKHVPQRTCVGCRQTGAKRALLRLVRTPEGRVVVDETGKRPGRGAYLCRLSSCWETALKRGSLNRALGIELDEETHKQLSEYAQKLPEKVAPG